MSPAKRVPTPEGAVLRFFRFSKGLSEGQLAARAGVSQHAVSRWENGDVPLSRERLEEILDEHLGVLAEAMDAALLAYRLGNLPAEAAGSLMLPAPESRLLDRAAAAGALWGAATARRELARERVRQRAAGHRAWADAEWSRLKELPARNQETFARLLQGGERSWALALRICDASEATAAHSADQALRLAKLAVSIADAVPGAEEWRLRLLGQCEPFLANASRVSGDLAAAEEAFVGADEHWRQGEGGDPFGLLDGTRRLDLKASLRRQQGQFAEALNLLDLALAASPPEATARLLLKKATTHSRAGDYQLAAEVLRQARPRIDEGREPRLLFLHLYTSAVLACHLDLYQDAEPLLPLIETLAADLRTELDGCRTVWLKGRILAGLGRREEAFAALSQVRRYFLDKKIAYDFALVSVELAALYLEQGRTRRVKELAEEMLWIFKGQKVHQEALAALALFRHAAELEEARAEWTRSLVRYLYRAQHNPGLRFER